MTLATYTGYGTIIAKNEILNIKGYLGALLELIIFFGFTYISKDILSIKYDSNISYYWLSFTILTGIWELFYILNHQNTIKYSSKLLAEKKHVWFKSYDIDMIFPWNLSTIFYAEYGAYADREYMTNKDKWSIIIEGTHSCLCAIFSAFSILYLSKKNNKNFYICLGISMGSQLMNSILYMGQYFIQIKDTSSINYNNNKFPCGKYLIKRPFMWINIFWTIMPIYLLSYNLLF